MSTQQAFFNETAQSATLNSDTVRPLSANYTIHVILSGTTYNVDVKLQVSGDGTNWADLGDASQTGIADGDNSVLFDVNAGFHNFVRVVVTRNSGTFNASGYLNNGREEWTTP